MKNWLSVEKAEQNVSLSCEYTHHFETSFTCETAYLTYRGIYVLGNHISFLRL